MSHPITLILREPALRLVALATFLIGALAASVAPYMSLLAIETFGFSDAGFSVLMATSAMVTVSASVSVGIITDQSGKRRPVAILCAALIAAGGALVWALPSPITFTVTHVLLWPLGFTLVGQVFALSRLAAQAEAPAVRDGLMSTVRAFFALPFIVVLPMWAWGFGQGLPLTAIYVAGTALGLALLALAALGWPRDGQTRWTETRSGLSFRAALAELAVPRVSIRVALVATVTSSVTLYMALTGLLFHEAPGRGEADTSLFVGLVAGLEVPVMLATPWLLTHLPKRTLIAGAAILHGAFLASFGQLAGASLVWLLAFPAAIGAGIILSVPIAYLQDLLATRPGTGGALLALVQVGAQLVSAAVFWAGTGLSGYALAATLGAVVVALSGLALFLVDRRE